MSPPRLSEFIDDDDAKKPDADDPFKPADVNLQWVTVDRPGTRLDSRQMSTVRSHVMKRYQQAQGQIRKEKEAKEEKERLRTQPLSPEDDLSIHQSEALRPELNALAQALGFDPGARRRPGFESEKGTSSRKHGQQNWRSYRPGRLDSLIYSSQPGGEQRPLAIYCIVCGEPECALHRSSRRQNDMLVVDGGETMIVHNFEPSPQGLLGAGRVNPFVGMYPIGDAKPYIHELMDHALTYLLPGLVPDGMSRQLESVSQAWFSSALKFPFLFHALVFAGSVHLDFLSHGKIHPNKPLSLFHKLSVIQSLRQIMQEPEKAAAIDEVILSVSVLSSHEVLATSSESKWSPWNSPLKTLTWLDVYGNIAYVPAHAQAVMELVTIRGGLEKIKLCGLAEVIAGGDVNGATSTLTKPILPLMRRSKQYIGHVRQWAKPINNLATARLCQGFRKYRDSPMRKALEVMSEMADLTTAIDCYLQGRPRCLKLGIIAVARFSIQHRLMSLPHAKETSRTNPLSATEDLLNLIMTPSTWYEACLAAATIYSIAVIFPVPNARRIMQPLVERLRQSIPPLDIEDYESDDLNLLLWILTIGGIAALQTGERRWFVESLAALVAKLEIDSWTSVEWIMESFLWLESACSPGGRLLWEEVMRA